MTAHPRCFSVLASLVLGLAHAAAQAHQVTHGDLVLAHPYVQLDPACGTATTRAHVMLILNRGPHPDRLIAARLDDAGDGKLVRWSTVDGQPARDVLADGVSIPAKGQIALMAPALEIEFPKSRAVLVEGGAAKGSLTFERGGTVPVTFMVDAAHEGQSRSGCSAAPATSAHTH